MDEFQNLQKRVKDLEKMLAILVKSNRYTINKNLELAPGTQIFMGKEVNFVVDEDTGTKIGTSTSAKLSLWNKTPIIQPNLSAQAPNRAASYSQSEAQDVTDAINEIRTDLISFGFYPDP